MAEGHRSLEDLAAAILDGASIDWESEESRAGAVDRPLLSQLRLLAIVADVHRRPRSPAPPVATSAADSSPPALDGRETADSKDPFEASLGHGGRPLTAGWFTSAIYVSIVAAAVARIAVALMPQQTMVLMPAAGLAWMLAFLGFAADRTYQALMQRLLIWRE